MGELPPQKEECRRSIKTAHTHAHTHTHTHLRILILQLVANVMTHTFQHTHTGANHVQLVILCLYQQLKAKQQTKSPTFSVQHPQCSSSRTTKMLLVGQYVHTLDTLSMEPRDMSSRRQSNKQGHSAQFPAW